ncbi:hypothetical protein HK096_009648, partial [Nowakowskiella sp. JEL0078]
MASFIVFVVFLIFVSTVKAHGYITGIVSGGQWYGGYEPNYKYYSSPPAVAGWTTEQINGPLFPYQYQSPEIICSTNSTSGKFSIPVVAGSTLQLQWTVWPDSHHGPVVSYIAPCSGSDCTTVSSADLNFVKIAEEGYISGTVPGYWAADKLRDNNNTAVLTIPSYLKPGPYVLRHEILALHAAYSINGTQNYPYCINLIVSGSGTQSPTNGLKGTALYTIDGTGIIFDIYKNFTSYPIPGPPLWTGSGSSSSTSTTSKTTTTTATSSKTTTITA